MPPLKKLREEQFPRFITIWILHCQYVLHVLREENQVWTPRVISHGVRNSRKDSEITWNARKDFYNQIQE